MLSEKVIECLEVACFLVVHMLHERAKMWVGFDDRRGLSRIYERGSQFSGLIDSKRAVKEILLLLRQLPFGTRLTFYCLIGE